MSSPQGPNEPNEQWASQPGHGEGHAAPTAPEHIQQPLPNPYPADVYGGGAYPPPGQGYPGQHGQPQNQAWGQPYPGAPDANQQWGGGGQAWGQPSSAQPQWNPQMGGSGQYAGQSNAGQPSQAQQYPGQQWGAQPGYPQAQFGTQPPNQWAAQPMQPVQPATTGGKGKPVMWAGIGLAVIAVIAVVGLALSGVFGGKTLDQAAAQKGVEQIVTESYGARSVSDVSCPSGQEVSEGNSFQCSLTVDGAPKKVTVTFTDNDGKYSVSRPS
ncbi:DUF4333 domain-containing protein [Rhodococcus sp. TAF43]|uniref:DUF4333 domain-containing protein n=1 Tax=unclassified Rhodococcus (in: high G+C Gram-positive bacteria) TaxID=192944 RepID=UPI00158268D8|nr:DUF4333 domain-containing protein [Rhodococcus sp. W8901]QKT11558.1 DUF4333 domain-containing protein [Rhodococcus sp. W8901]